MINRVAKLLNQQTALQAPGCRRPLLPHPGRPETQQTLALAFAEFATNRDNPEHFDANCPFRVLGEHHRQHRKRSHYGQSGAASNGRFCPAQYSANHGRVLDYGDQVYLMYSSGLKDPVIHKSDFYPSR
ncbi:MAG: hypothetical protein H6661_09495 [Ardenticatenaceae bacterium]|nr:hypothetical protein [Ardenticatenaceae bacterium]